MKNILTIALSLVIGFSATAQFTKKHMHHAKDHKLLISALLQQNSTENNRAKTTAGVPTQRVIAQSTRDNDLASLSDSVKLKYSGMRKSVYDYNNMIYAYNYTYSTSPMFDFAGIFTTPQVKYDTCLHWTMDPFSMPSFVFYESKIATYDTNDNQISFQEIFPDTLNDDRIYHNTFNTNNTINSGLWINFNTGIPDSAFKQYFSYGTTGKLVKDSIYEYHMGAWKLVAKTNYTYSGTGNLLQIDHFANLTDTTFLLPLIQQSKYVNTYDASNRLITVQTSFYDGTVLGAYVRDTFGYSGTMTYHNSWKQHQYDPIHGTWWPQYNMSKHITGSKPDTVFHKGWDSIANAWSPTSMQIVGYNTNNDPDTIQQYMYNWTSYSVTPDYTTVYYYETFLDTTPVLSNSQLMVDNSATIKLYPNPTTSEIHIELAGKTSNLNITVYNTSGQIVSRQQSVNTSHQIVDTNFLPAGAYFVEVVSDYGKQTKQFVRL
jgi:hypothetical protein